MRTGVYICNTIGKTELNKNLITWVAIPIDSHQRIELTKRLNEYVEQTKEQLGISTLNFCDIFNGTGDFEDVDIEIRFGIFADFVQIYNQYKCKVIQMDKDVDDHRFVFVKLKVHQKSTKSTAPDKGRISSPQH